MVRILRWCLILGCLLTLVMPVLAADDDEEDNAGATLDTGMQWRLACNAWDRREYDDSTAIMLAFAEKNPDDDNTLEAWWRSYEVFRAYRPNEKRRKETYEKAMEACDRWTKKYNESNPDRAARGMSYKGNLYKNEGNAPLAIATLTNLLKKYPDVNGSILADVYWRLGEWLREARRYSEAIPNYAGYRKTVGTSTEYAALSAYYEGLCDEELGNKEAAIAAYKIIIQGGYNWGWGQVHWNALYAARRIKAMGEDQVAREFLIRLIDKCDRNWDVTKQAMAELGEKPAMRIWIHPHLYYRYYGSTVNIDARSKITLRQEINLLVRATYIDKNNPFKGTISFSPKDEMAKIPDGMKPAEGDGKTYQAEITTPQGGDFWYHFLRADQSVNPPEGAVISRKWTKMGNTWGEAEIRIQSTGRWHVWIYMPNNKTNANNLNVQPNEVHDGGKLFRWYDWYDLNQGMTIKFPIEIGANTAEYYPKIRMERWAGPGYAERSGTGTETTYDMREGSVKVKSDTAFPYTITFPTYTEITLDEVMK